MNQKLKIVISGILLYSLSCNSAIYAADQSFVKRSTAFIKDRLATFSSAIAQSKNVTVSAKAAAAFVVGAFATGATAAAVVTQQVIKRRNLQNLNAAPKKGTEVTQENTTSTFELSREKIEEVISVETEQSTGTSDKANTQTPASETKDETNKDDASTEQSTAVNETTPSTVASDSAAATSDDASKRETKNTQELNDLTSQLEELANPSAKPATEENTVAAPLPPALSPEVLNDPNNRKSIVADPSLAAEIASKIPAPETPTLTVKDQTHETPAAVNSASDASVAEKPVHQPNVVTYNFSSVKKDAPATPAPTAVPAASPAPETPTGLGGVLNPSEGY